MIINLRNFSSKAVLILFLATFFLSSCITNERITYFQNKNTATNYTDTMKYDRSLYKLQVNDILTIDVKTQSEAFQRIFMSSAAGLGNIASIGGATGGDLYYTIGYTINDSGAIRFPVLGSVYVAGLNLREIEHKLEKELATMQYDVLVTVRMGGLRFSLLGEFNRPGKYVAMQNQLTIFEAIALGGDMKEIARRDKVTLVRQYPDGVQIHYIDVLDKNIIKSPYYFIQPNDLIYVEPLKRRAYGVGVNGLQTLTTSLTVITTALLLISYFRR